MSCRYSPRESTSGLGRRSVSDEAIAQMSTDIVGSTFLELVFVAYWGRRLVQDERELGLRRE